MTSNTPPLRRRRFLRGALALAALSLPGTAGPTAGARAQTRMLVPTIDKRGDRVILAGRYFLEDHAARYRIGVGAPHPAFRDAGIELSLEGAAEVGPPIEFVEDLGPTRVRVGRVLATGFVLDGRKQFWRDSVTMTVELPTEALRRLGVLYFFLAVSGGTDSQGNDIWRVEQAGTVDTTFL